MHLITVYFRCGSIIVDFMLKFNKSVVVSEVITTLQEAAKGGTFGGLQISSIARIFPQPTTPTEGTIFGRSLNNVFSILLTCSSCRKHPAFF